LADESELSPQGIVMTLYFVSIYATSIRVPRVQVRLLLLTSRAALNRGTSHPASF